MALLLALALAHTLELTEGEADMVAEEEPEEEAAAEELLPAEAEARLLLLPGEEALPEAEAWLLLLAEAQALADSAELAAEEALAALEPMPEAWALELG